MPQQSTKGPIHKVPCPWCNQPNDFRVLADASNDKGGGISGWGSQGLETGATVDCDHCGQLAKVLAIETIQLVQLAPTKKG